MSTEDADSSPVGPRTPRYCGTCGTPARLDQAYCEGCGSRLGGSDPGSQNRDGASRQQQAPSARKPDRDQPGPGEAAPPRQVRMKQLVVIALAALGVILVILAIVTSPRSADGGGSGGEFGGGNPDVEYIRRALDAYNHDPNRVYLSALSQLGETRCGLDFSADFPDYVLITVVSSSGNWMQASVHPESGVDQSGFRNGPDYVAAGIDPNAFPYYCRLKTDGSVVFVG